MIHPPANPASEVAKKDGSGIYFMPRCTIQTRWESGTCLLMDRAYARHIDCTHWGATNWFALHAFGLGYEGIEQVDVNDPSPFPYIEADMLGVGRIAVIAGPKWEAAFPEHALAPAHLLTPTCNDSLQVTKQEEKS